jgi:hypothetical protein
MVNLTTMLAHASGEWIASDWPVRPVAGTAATTMAPPAEGQSPRAHRSYPPDQSAVLRDRLLAEIANAHRVGNEAAWWKDAGIDPAKAARKPWNDTRMDQGRIGLGPTRNVPRQVEQLTLSNRGRCSCPA